MSLHAGQEEERSNELNLWRHRWREQTERGGRENSGRTKYGLGGGEHEDGGLLWHHDLPHLKLVEQWMNNKRQDSY